MNHFSDIEPVLAGHGAKAGNLESIHKAVENNISQIANLAVEVKEHIIIHVIIS